MTVPAGSNSQSAPAISARRLSKFYKMYESPRDLLIEAVTGRPRHYNKAVLKDIDFEISRGEVVGIIGQNGAGKSTLLKIIAGTLKPSTGAVKVYGRTAAILELGTGFNPNYSGRENVIVSGMLRGMTEQEVRAKLDSIISFSGLEHAINDPFHTYSSGMQARLAFATAISVDADVVIIDEALAAGDVRFAARSLNRIREISQSGVTCLFVSHVTYQIMQLCSRAIWIDQGRIKMDGPAIDVVRAYEYEMHGLIARDRGDILLPDGGTQTSVVEAREEQLASQGSIESVVGTRPEQLTANEPSAGAEHVGIECHDQGQNEAGDAEAERSPEIELREEAGAIPIATASTGSSSSDVRRTEATLSYCITQVTFSDDSGQEGLAFRFGEPLRLTTFFEVRNAGTKRRTVISVTFNRATDQEPVMYFESEFPTDRLGKTKDISPASFCGVIEARIEPLQIRTGEYDVSIEIRWAPEASSNGSGQVVADKRVRIAVLPNGFEEPSVFYPIVSWTNVEDVCSLVSTDDAV